MASTTEPEKIVPPPEAHVAEPEKTAPSTEAQAREPEKGAPPPEAPPLAPVPPPAYYVVADVVLRFLLFAAAVVSVVVMVTSKQTEVAPIQIPIPPFRAQAELQAKFNHSPAFIYFVAALSVAGVYSIITAFLSLLALLKPGSIAKLWVHIVILDVLLLGIVASATGAAGGVAYIGLKGNSHAGWNKVCNIYDIYCRHLAGSIAVSLFASVFLVLLVLLSVYTLSKKIPH
ncbi:unnamed protein product [Ilex paraguariensis]|uniref:CASP-like protein n=1 Tax=Ilex paraguariensis TaxID=185542 RepID=A0ABC8RLB8_9AQUA